MGEPVCITGTVLASTIPAVNLSSADIQQILSSPLQASSDGPIVADLTNDDQMVAPELLYGYGELIKSEMPEKNHSNEIHLRMLE